VGVKVERAYREDELLDALVIDSEGYVYGKVGKIKISEDEVLLLVNEYKPDVKTVVDVASLKEELLKGAKKNFGSRLRRMTLSDILAKDVRKDLGLGLDDQLADEHFLKYAERLGIPIRYTKVASERKDQKGAVSLNEIKTIKTTVIGREKGTTVIRVILLREPKEAAFRGIPVQENAPYRSTEAVKDKLVLETNGQALGYVDSVVLFDSMPGIRVYVSKTGGLVNLSLLTRYLEESGQSDVADLMRKQLMNPELNRYNAEIEEVEDFMRQTRLSFRVPEKIISSHHTREFVADIPWNNIHKIGDVILLKSTLTDLRSKGYIQGL